jgi:hypothetical protein
MFCHIKKGQVLNFCNKKSRDPKCGSQLKKLHGPQSFTGKYRTLNSAKKTKTIISEVVMIKTDTKIHKSAMNYSTWTMQVKKYPTFYEITTAGHLRPFAASWIWFPS